MFENPKRVTAKLREGCEQWTSHRFGWDSWLVSEPTQRPEAELIERLRTQARPELSVRNAARQAEISEGRWRQIIKGYKQESGGVRVSVRAPAGTLARMARVVGATPNQLREVARDDAADELEALARQLPLPGLESRPVRSARLEMLHRLANPVPTAHDGHFERAERLLLHSHESVRTGDYLGAIHGLEGVQSTVELLIDRVTDSAIQQNEGATRAVSTEPSAQQDAQEEGIEDKKTDDDRSADNVELGPNEGLDADIRIGLPELNVDSKSDKGKKSG